MLLSFKRMNNILSQFMAKNKGYKLSFSASLLAENEEKRKNNTLFDQLDSDSNPIVIKYTLK